MEPFSVLPPAEAEQAKADFDAALGETEARIKELEDQKKKLAARLAAVTDSGFRGFELQPLGVDLIPQGHKQTLDQRGAPPAGDDVEGGREVDGGLGELGALFASAL